MEFINSVVLQGYVDEVRTSPKGSNFITLRQNAIYSDGTVHTKFFELLINYTNHEFINKFKKNDPIKINGHLTIFKDKKINSYKIIVEVEKAEII
jgi:hypothetical protein